MSTCGCGRPCAGRWLYAGWLVLVLALSAWHFAAKRRGYREEAASNAKAAAEHRQKAERFQARAEWDGDAAAAREHRKAAEMFDGLRKENETWGPGLALCKAIPWFVIPAVAPWAVWRMRRGGRKPPEGAGAPPDSERTSDAEG